MTLTKETLDRLKATRAIVEEIVDSGTVRYGINTGFGLLSQVLIEKEKLVELQYNLIRYVN